MVTVLKNSSPVPIQPDPAGSFCQRYTDLVCKVKLAYIYGWIKKEEDGRLLAYIQVVTG